MIQKEKKNKVDLVLKQTTQIQVVISKTIKEQLNYICSSISHIEWSGIVFYKIEGSIKEPSKMKIVVEEILPLDIGDHTRTAYDFDEIYINYIMEDPKRGEYKVGHLHSHHNMGVYFSGTDDEEIYKNVFAHNIYFSLIVNNALEMVAKVVTVAKVSKEISLPFYLLDSEGEKYPLDKKISLPVEKNVVIEYNCKIKSPKFVDRLCARFKGYVQDIQRKQYADFTRKTSMPSLPSQNNNFKSKNSKPGVGGEKFNLEFSQNMYPWENTGSNILSDQEKLIDETINKLLDTNPEHWSEFLQDIIQNVQEGQEHLIEIMDEVELRASDPMYLKVRETLNDLLGVMFIVTM